MSITLAIKRRGTDIEQEMARVMGYGLSTGFDLETTGIDPRKHKLVSVAFKPQDRKPVIIDARDMDRGFLCDLLTPYFADKHNRFIGQGLAFDLHWLMSYVGIPCTKIQARFYDTYIVELLILGMGVSEARNAGIGMGLGEIAARYGLEVSKEERNWFIDLDKRPDEWNASFPYEQLQYIRQDVSVVHLLAREQDKIIKQYGLEEVVELESRVIPATAAMSHFGVGVDRAVWNSVMGPINEVISRYEEEIHEKFDVPILQDRREKYMAKYEPYRAWIKERDDYITDAREAWGDQKFWGEEKKRVIEVFKKEYGVMKPPPAMKDGVNLGSWKQVLVGFQAMGFDFSSVKEEELAPYAGLNPVVQLYMDYVAHTTIAKRYNLSFLEKFAPLNRLYAGWFQLGTGTGRYSSHSPNFQQFPDNGPGARLRQAIIPSPGYCFVDADFSNVELRIGAELSGDAFLLEAFATGIDVHAHTAIVMFDLKNNREFLRATEGGMTIKGWTDSKNAVVGGKEIDKSYRQVAKKINYMLLYGGGRKRLAAELRVSEQDAKALLDLHFQAFKTIMTWIRNQGGALDEAVRRQQTRTYGSTRSGRRRWFSIPTLALPRDVTAEDALEAQQEWRKQMAGIRRQLVNGPIQGLSADISKFAMAEWHAKYNSEDMHMVAAIHDEFLLEVKDDPATVSRAQEALAECMLAGLHRYLHVVDVGEVHPTVERYWNH